MSETKTNRFQAQFGLPSERARVKVKDFMEQPIQEFIRHAPFAVMATSNDRGECDATPKGGRPGFVRVLDERHLLLPDVKGNRLFQSYENIDANGRVGLIFFLPGVEETLRIRGRALITRDLELLAPLALNGKTPKLGLLVEIDTVFFQCAKALIRSKLWDPATPIKRSEFPTFAQITRDQRRPDAKVEDIAALIQDSYQNMLY